MADNKATKADTVSFTPNETQFLLSALKHVEGPIKFDTEAVAAELGLKDATVARARWNTIYRQKIQGGSSGPSGGIQKKTPSKKSTPKKANKDGETNNVDDEEAGTPTKTPKKRGRKSKVETALKQEDNVKEEEVEDVMETTEKDEEGELENLN